MKRRSILSAAGAGLSALALPSLVRAQALEKPKLTIAVGGKNLLYYLPLTIAETQGYFKDEGLDLTIADFAGGSRACRPWWAAAPMWCRAPSSTPSTCRSRASSCVPSC